MTTWEEWHDTDDESNDEAWKPNLVIIEENIHENISVISKNIGAVPDFLKLIDCSGR